MQESELKLDKVIIQESVSKSIKLFFQLAPDAQLSFDLNASDVQGVWHSEDAIQVSMALTMDIWSESKSNVIFTCKVVGSILATVRGYSEENLQTILNAVLPTYLAPTLITKVTQLVTDAGYPAPPMPVINFSTNTPKVTTTLQ